MRGRKKSCLVPQTALFFESYDLKAYVTDSESIDIMKEYAEDAKKYGNPEGFTFKFTIDPDFSKIKAPCCYLEHISDSFTIKGNCIDSNCDTYGTIYGVKAEFLYLLFVEDLNKLAIARYGTGVRKIRFKRKEKKLCLTK